MKPIKVLVVDDSAVVRKTLEKALSKEKDITVIGAAPDPYVARDLIVELKPDVITLDVEMPRMDGITFLRKIMRYVPTPVIVVSSLTKRNSKLAVQALKNGAVDVIQKPESSYSLGNLAFDLSNKIRAASKVSVSNLTAQEFAEQESLSHSLSQTTNKIIAIGASTGGTRAVENVLRRFPSNMPGIVIVQHMPPVFTTSFSRSLDKTCNLKVKEAENGETICPGTVYIAPGGYHLMVKRSGAQYVCELRSGPFVHYQKPAVDILFKSVAKYVGSNAIGVILTGMGSDGADGLLKMKEKGARTLAQDEKSCVVYGMPKAAVDLNAAEEVLPVGEISEKIVQLLQNM